MGQWYFHGDSDVSSHTAHCMLLQVEERREREGGGGREGGGRGYHSNS